MMTTRRDVGLSGLFHALGQGTVSALLLLLSLAASSVLAAEHFVAPDGNDTNAGTIDRPFATMGRAQTAANPGDTVWFRGGRYDIKPGNLAARGNAVHVYEINKSGTATAPIKYFAYKDEKPVFDFSTVKPAARVYCYYVSANWIHFKGLEVVGVQVTQTGHTQSECFENHGSNNIYEQLSMHDGMAIGFYLLSGSNNLIINCDAYNNWDSVSEDGKGGNTDGFGCHASKGGTGNVFRYCRAWYNSDDGYDCINCAESVMFDHCWAMYSGLNAKGQSLGDGNGFKAGGYGSTPAARLPNPIPRNTIQFCLSVGNKVAGYYANHHTGGSDWLNNSAYRNGINFNMLERQMDNVTNIPGPNAFMRNNLGYKGKRDVANLDEAKSNIVNNSFTLGLKITDADFESLDEAQLVKPRKPDGSLPDITFMHLTKNSALNGKAVEIKNDKGELRFPGVKLELGAFGK